MNTRQLIFPRGFDIKTQKQVGRFVAEMDDQLVKLKKAVKDLTVEQLEWQQRPGMNTVGMLLAHLALVEIWWIKLAPAEMPWLPEGKAQIQKICGFEDDGLPLPPDGVHPSYIIGYTAEKYLLTLDKCRRVVKTELKKWRDKELGKFYKAGKNRITCDWTLYHVLEHFAGHFGQILLLKHLMRDAGVLAKEEPAKP